MTPETTKLRSVEDLVYETLCEINAKSNCGCGGYIDYDVEVPMLTKVITQDRQALLDAVVGVLDGMKRKHYDEQQPFLKHRNDFNDAYNEVVEDAKTTIKNLLDVNKGV